MQRSATGGSTERPTAEQCLYPPAKKKLRATEEMSYAVYIYGYEFSFTEHVAALLHLSLVFCNFTRAWHRREVPLSVAGKLIRWSLVLHYQPTFFRQFYWKQNLEMSAPPMQPSRTVFLPWSEKVRAVVELTLALTFAHATPVALAHALNQCKVCTLKLLLSFAFSQHSWNRQMN